MLNAGVRSAPTYLYEVGYWESHVAAAKPDVILAEAHTINNWLHGNTPQVYGESLAQLLTHYQTLTNCVAVISVAPIGGETRSPNGGEEYANLSAIVGRTARQLGLPLCDVETAILQQTADLNCEQYEREWLDDVWHPNNRGHEVYANILFEFFKNERLI